MSESGTERKRKKRKRKTRVSYPDYEDIEAMKEEDIEVMLSDMGCDSINDLDDGDWEDW